MKTKYLDELLPFQLKNELSKLGVELTDEQYRILLNRGRTFLYAHREKKKNSGSVLYRISYPFFIVWSVLVGFIIQPIKWVLTGDIYFKTDNPIYKFTIKWERKIGL